jgi:CRISPR system Cascade subunit CasA
MHATEDGRTPLALAFADNLLNAAGLEMLAGFLQVLDPPADEGAWVARWREGIGPKALKAAFEPHAPSFEVYGSHPAFQDSTVAASKEWPVEKLFHASSGENTRKQNKDFSGGSVDRMGLGTAMLALYAQQSHAMPGGPGFRTSIAGGGPLRCIPEVGDTLFQRVWALVLSRPEFASLGNGTKAAAADILPWLRPGSRKVTRADAPASHLYFATPRRVMLGPPEGRGTCPLTGTEGPLVATMREAQDGPEYTNGGWEHPLTPYRRKLDKKTGVQTFPVLASGYGLGVCWRDRVGLVLDRVGDDGGGVSPSLIVTRWRTTRAREVLRDRTLRVAAYGVRAKQATMAGYVLSSQPVRLVSLELEGEYEALFSQAARAADRLAWLLEVSARDAWFSKSEQDKLRRARKPEIMDERIDPLVIRFWGETEPDADAFAEAVAAALEGEADDAAIDAAREQLLSAIARAALTTFDEALRGGWDADPARVAQARTILRWAAHRRDVRGALGLPIRQAEEAG